MKANTWIRYIAGLHQGEIKEIPTPRARVFIANGFAERVTDEEVAALEREEEKTLEAELDEEPERDEETDAEEVEDLAPGRKKGGR